LALDVGVYTGEINDGNSGACGRRFEVEAGFGRMNEDARDGGDAGIGKTFDAHL